MPAASESPLIRIATPADARRLSVFAARLFAATYAADNTADDMRAYLAEHFTPVVQERELGDASWTTLVAVDGDTWLGYAQLRRGEAPAFVPGTQRIELARVYVAPEAHRRGIGTLLIDDCAALSLRERRDVLWLAVWERNARAIAFYEHSGFTRVGTQTFELGSDRQTDWVMARPLTSAAGA